MLVHLSIHNYAIVDHLDLELDAGMSAISGETGAGKSIMLDALGLTLGDREDLHMVVEAQGDEAVQIRAFQHDAAIGRRQILDQGDGQGAELQLVPHATRDAQEPGHARSTLSAASFSMAAMV